MRQQQEITRASQRLTHHSTGEVHDLRLGALGQRDNAKETAQKLGELPPSSLFATTTKALGICTPSFFVLPPEQELGGPIHFGGGYQGSVKWDLSPQRESVRGGDHPCG